MGLAQYGLRWVYQDRKSSSFLTSTENGNMLGKRIIIHYASQNNSGVGMGYLINAFRDRIIPHGFCQLVQGVIRTWPGAESTLLDHHWTNHQEKVSDVHAYFQGASDNKMICCIRRTKKVISKPYHYHQYKTNVLSSSSSSKNSLLSSSS